MLCQVDREVFFTGHLVSREASSVYNMLDFPAVLLIDPP